jgi:hypothetical protein
MMLTDLENTIKHARATFAWLRDRARRVDSSTANGTVDCATNKESMN